jgi:putative spermidine/putrescine transport system ATP-binding protein
MRLRESAIHFDTFNNPSVPPPERGQPVTVGFSREDILVLEGAAS